MNDIREKYYGGENASKEAFEELCAMVENMNVGIIYHKIQKQNKIIGSFSQKVEREERRDKVKAKIAHLRSRNAHLRERNARLRDKYVAMVDL